MKGGRVMLSPSYEEQICAMFDSFCKTVSRNCVRNLKRAVINRRKHYIEEPIDPWGEILGKSDSYPSDFFRLYIDGRLCIVESETLYNALLSLPKKQRKVLLLDFWCGLQDKEIAANLGMTTRTVYNLRQRAFKTIRGYYARNIYSGTKL